MRSRKYLLELLSMVRTCPCLVQRAQTAVRKTTASVLPAPRAATFRRAGCALTMMVALVLAAADRGHSEATPAPSGAFASFLSFATNLPPISNMVVDMSLGASPMRLQFRYQEDAFFGRQLNSTNPAADIDWIRDEMCGRWRNDYWYYDPASRTLHEYRFARNDTNASAYVGQMDFRTYLGKFQSFGSSDQGPNSLFWNNGQLAFVDAYRHCTNYVTLHLSNGVPSSASMERTMDKGRTAHFEAQWAYDTSVAPSGIPVAVKLGHDDWQWIRLRTFALGSPASPLPKELFFPSNLFTNQRIAHILHTNSADYVVNRGKLSPLER